MNLFKKKNKSAKCFRKYNERFVSNILYINTIFSQTSNDQTLYFYVVLRGRRRQARSVFDGFRDFQAEASKYKNIIFLPFHFHFILNTPIIFYLLGPNC